MVVSQQGRLWRRETVATELVVERVVRLIRSHSCSLRAAKSFSTALCEVRGPCRGPAAYRCLR